jgi:hypothetical protein
VALKEIGVRPAWRKTGTARRIHDTVFAARDELYVTLMVNPAAGDGRSTRSANRGATRTSAKASRHRPRRYSP